MGVAPHKPCVHSAPVDTASRAQKLAYLGEHSYSSGTFLKVIFQHTWTVVWCVGSHRFTQVSRYVATGSQKRSLNSMNTRRSAYWFSQAFIVGSELRVYEKGKHTYQLSRGVNWTKILARIHTFRPFSVIYIYMLMWSDRIILIFLRNVFSHGAN